MPDDQNNAQEEMVDKWVPTKRTVLDSLVAVADGGEEGAENEENSAAEPVPWQPGHALELSGYGGQRVLERRRVTAAADRYVSFVTGNLDMQIEGNYTSSYNGGIIKIKPEEAVEGEAEEGNQSASDKGRLLQNAVVTPGVDSLTVHGNADLTSGTRNFAMSGSINRLWVGGITKVVGMEGVICGGTFLRTHAGPSATMSALCSGDVYGGAARVSAARIHMALLSYRSLDGIAWACGYWGRFSSFVIIPPIQTDDAKDGPLKKKAKWALKIAGGILPAIEILWGVGSFLLMIPLLLIMGLCKLVRWMYRTIVIHVRSLTQDSGVKVQGSATDTTF